MTVLSEIVRFVLPAHRAADFARLRSQVARQNAVRSQYYGASIAASLPLQPHEMCWVIQWTGTRPSTLKAQLDGFVPGHTATSLLFVFEEKQATNIEQALEAPICQFATINLKPDAPVDDPALQRSMHKTYTDCFLTQEGFIGGDWAYATNTNNVNDERLDQTSPLDSGDRRLGVYFLGWESRAAHDAYSRTALFDEEIDKLMPWFGPGTGAWYVNFEKHED
ncbi:hypothetical protein SEUCBS140593_001567 [Sporothrix eucalyptigena]|uniref:Uncharacterized protein n=1 Tax=Sporothrix eucalyptigena TaxID=1812306 RepID=A0ABP0AZD1_9PEZI